MKGLELPINMIVVVAIAVLVLVVVAAFFIGGFKPIEDIGAAAAYGQGCNTLKAVYGCVASSVNDIRITGYNPDNRPVDPGVPYEGETLMRACSDKFKTSITDVQCAVSCGCGQ